MTTKQTNPFLVEVYEMVEALYENFDPTNGNELHAHEKFEKLLQEKCGWADGRAETSKMYGTDLGPVVNDLIERAEGNIRHLQANRTEDNAKTAAWNTVVAWRATYPLQKKGDRGPGTLAAHEILTNENDAHGWAILDDLKEEIQGILPALAQLGAEADTPYDDLEDAQRVPDLSPNNDVDDDDTDDSLNERFAGLDLGTEPPPPVPKPVSTKATGALADEIAAWGDE